jgi:hypothetical protein
MTQHVSSFYTNELARALREAAFGIHSYDVLPPMAVQDASQDSQAIARVALLEGITIYLRLSITGYQVCPPPTSFLPTLTLFPVGPPPPQVIGNPEDSANPGSPQLEIVESLDTMLRVLSPIYATKHTDLLVKRLRQEAIHR